MCVCVCVCVCERGTAERTNPDQVRSIPSSDFFLVHSFSSSSFLTSSPSLKADSLRRDVILIYHAQPVTVFM